MKRKIISLALSAVMATSALALLTSCGKPTSSVKEDVVKLKTTAPICFTASEYTDSSIAKSTFTVEYDATHTLTAVLADATLGTLTEVSSSTTDGKVSVTYEMASAGAVGSSVVNFLEGEKVVDTVPVSVKTAYPEKGFKPIAGGRATRYSHDPVVIEIPEGVEFEGETYYYASYCTDNEGGGFGAPIKLSKDLVEWTRAGSAIPDYGDTLNKVKKNCSEGTSELQDVYDLISADDSWGNVWTLWAPEVVPAPNGGYWLYGSWTTAFGSRRSIIFQCYSESPLGPFKYRDIIVYSPNTRNDNTQSNAIDPSVYYDADGNMYLSYGSFSDFRSIPLDKNTGFRRDGARFSVADMKKSEDFYESYYKDYKCDWNEDYDDLSEGEKYFGEMILKNTAIEGSVIEYVENVPVYKGDVKDYSDSKLTYENNYYMVGSAGGLDKNYSMRVFKAKNPTDMFTDSTGSTTVGSVISATYSWAESKSNVFSLNFYVPGHNDLLTTSANERFITYHNRVEGNDFSFATGHHYLTTSITAFNSKGDLVMSPVRYTGESLRKVTADEMTKYSNGNYLGIVNDSSNFGKIYYAEKYALNADGTISGAKNGTWTLYGDNYVYIVLDGVEYYGVVMPGYCTQEAKNDNGFSGKGGLVISALSSNTTSKMTLYMEMAF